MELEQILESVLFAAQKPLTPRELRDVLNLAADQSTDEAVKAFHKRKEDEILAALECLRNIHADAGRTYRLACVAGSWQFVSQPEFAPWIMALVGQKPRPPRLSQPALETLTIIAYRQPITRAEIEQVRGVAVDGVMGTLVERGLVEQAGRAEVIGRPMTYATTPLFLEYFGLRSLADLPSADELRRIPVKRPEKLLTVEDAPGDLATAPPAELAGQTAEPPSAEAALVEEASSQSQPDDVLPLSEPAPTDSEHASAPPAPPPSVGHEHPKNETAP